MRRSGKEGQTAGDDVSVATTLSDLSHNTATTTSISKVSQSARIAPLDNAVNGSIQLGH
jgi:hypothetical protein